MLKNITFSHSLSNISQKSFSIRFNSSLDAHYRIISTLDSTDFIWFVFMSADAWLCDIWLDNGKVMGISIILLKTKDLDRNFNLFKLHSVVCVFKLLTLNSVLPPINLSWAFSRSHPYLHTFHRNQKVGHLRQILIKVQQLTSKVARHSKLHCPVNWNFFHVIISFN